MIKFDFFFLRLLKHLVELMNVLKLGENRSVVSDVVNVGPLPKASET